MRGLAFAVFAVACLIFQEGWSLPEKSMQDKAEEMLDRVKARAQEAVEHAQEAVSKAVETAKERVHEAIQSAQETAQQGMETGREWVEYGKTVAANMNHTATDKLEKPQD